MGKPSLRALFDAFLKTETSAPVAYFGAYLSLRGYRPTDFPEADWLTLGEELGEPDLLEQAAEYGGRDLEGDLRPRSLRSRPFVE